MKGIITVAWMLVLASLQVSAQDSSFSVHLSDKTVESGQVFKINFEIKNIKGEFEAPDFTPFQVIGGPNQSSSFQMINGKVTRAYTYSYYLRAPEPGIYLIPEAVLYTDEEMIRTKAVEITVLGKGEPLPSDEPPVDSMDALQEILKNKKIKKF